MSRQTDASVNYVPQDQVGKVAVYYPREVVERDVMFEFMALRDERFLEHLSEEERKRLGDNPVGQIAHLTTEELGQVGSVTSGLFCKGTPGCTHGVTCKVLKIPAPP